MRAGQVICCGARFRLPFELLLVLPPAQPAEANRLKLFHAGNRRLLCRKEECWQSQDSSGRVFRRPPAFPRRAEPRRSQFERKYRDRWARGAHRSIFLSGYFLREGKEFRADRPRNRETAPFSARGE